MPAQVVAQRGALSDQVFAVIDEQTNIELGSGKLRDGQRVEAFARRRARDRDGIDRVGLAAFAGGVALANGELGRDADDRFAVGEQEALKRAGNVPAVFDRPDALAAVAAGPGELRLKAATLRRHRSFDEHASAGRLNGGDRVRALMRVGTDHDHRLRSSLGCCAGDRIAGGQFSVQKHRATHLLGHAGDPRTAAGDTTSASQIKIDRQKVNESARHRSEDLPDAPDATARRPGLLH
jgi:hypothetical protein